MLEHINAALAEKVKGATHAAEPHGVAFEACADVLGPRLAEVLAATDDGPAHPVDLGDSDEEPTEDVGLAKLPTTSRQFQRIVYPSHQDALCIGMQSARMKANRQCG